MTVLYGRNGAGKTRLLRAIEAIWSGASAGDRPIVTSFGGRAELIYEWHLPDWLATGRWPDGDVSDDRDGQGEIHDRPDVKEWKALPGNPWYVVEPEFDITSDFRGGVSRFGEAAELLDRVLPQSNLSFEPARLLARQIAFNLSIESCRDDESEARVAAVCDEIVGRARFCYSSKASTPVAVHDTDSPLLLQLIRDIRLEGREGDGDIWDLEASERLGLGHAGWLVPQQQGNEYWHVEVGGLPAAYPAWYGDVRSESLQKTQPPAQLVAEAGDDLAKLTIRALEDLLAPEGLQDGDGDPPGSLLSERADGSVVLRPELVPTVDSIAQQATRFARLLLEGAPVIRCEVSPVTDWYRRSPLRWVALDLTGTWVEVEDLSRAQRRWAELSIVLALKRRAGVPLVILLDEPEAALHRRAERHLVRGLERLSQELNASIVVATHSPAFFEQTSAHLVHVNRNAHGQTELAEMPTALRDRVDELGLNPTDLLQLCRTVVLVEGQHELAILGELIGDELRQVGAEMFAMRGVRKLGSAADAQLLFTYTDAALLVVVDNDDAGRVTDIWERACRTADDGGDHLRVLAEYTKNKRDLEQVALEEFCGLAITSGNKQRIRFQTLSLPDVPEYLPVRAVAPGSPADATWADLHAEHERTGKRGNRPRFKDWMTDTYGADYSESNLRAASGSMDSIPDDLLEILQAVTRVGR